MDKFNLNIAGAAADLAMMNTTSTGGVDESVSSLVGVSSNLYGGTMLGTGADTGTDLYHMLKSAMSSANEVVQGCNRAVGNASDNTQCYDRGGASSAIGGG